MSLILPTTEQIIELNESLPGHRVFYDPRKKGFNLNLGAIRKEGERTPKDEEIVTDLFDDYLYCYWQNPDGTWSIEWFRITTQPGLSYMGRKTGGRDKHGRPATMIMAEGFYEKVYAPGFHKGDPTRPALIQVGLFQVYRDGDMNNLYTYDPNTLEWGRQGANVHDPYQDEMDRMYSASAGCQVHWSKKESRRFMNIIYTSQKIWGGRFSYTLNHEREFRQHGIKIHL